MLLLHNRRGFRTAVFCRQCAGALAEEEQRLRRYGKAYLASNGPNREIVGRWLRYLDSRAGG